MDVFFTENPETSEIFFEYVKKNAPKSPMWRSLIAAFVVGGLICCVGQGVHDGVETLFPALTEEEIGSWTTVIMIFLGAFFTALGVYDRLGRVAGGGSVIPITGFAMFVIAGPIIVFGVVSGVVVGVIHLFV